MGFNLCRSGQTLPCHGTNRDQPPVENRHLSSNQSLWFASRPSPTSGMEAFFMRTWCKYRIPGAGLPKVQLVSIHIHNSGWGSSLGIPEAADVFALHVTVTMSSGHHCSMLCRQSYHMASPKLDTLIFLVYRLWFHRDRSFRKPRPKTGSHCARQHNRRLGSRPNPSEAKNSKQKKI